MRWRAGTREREHRTRGAGVTSAYPHSPRASRPVSRVKLGACPRTCNTLDDRKGLPRGAMSGGVSKISVTLVSETRNDMIMGGAQVQPPTATPPNHFGPLKGDQWSVPID